MTCRIWYGYDLQASMRNGVNKSTIFLACINEIYQKSTNCGFELEAALSMGKPVVVLCTQSDPFVWSKEPLKSRCKLSNNMFVNIGETAVEWEESLKVNNDGPSPELISRLGTELVPLIKILQELNCYPNMG